MQTAAEHIQAIPACGRQPLAVVVRLKWTASAHTRDFSSRVWAMTNPPRSESGEPIDNIKANEVQRGARIQSRIGRQILFAALSAGCV